MWSPNEFLTRLSLPWEMFSGLFYHDANFPLFQAIFIFFNIVHMELRTSIN